MIRILGREVRTTRAHIINQAPITKTNVKFNRQTMLNCLPIPLSLKHWNLDISVVKRMVKWINVTKTTESLIMASTTTKLAPKTSMTSTIAVVRHTETAPIHKTPHNRIWMTTNKTKQSLLVFHKNQWELAVLMGTTSEVSSEAWKQDPPHYVSKKSS